MRLGYYIHRILLLLAFIFLTGCSVLQQPEVLVENNLLQNLSGDEMLYSSGGQIFARDVNAQESVAITNNDKINFSPHWLKKGEEILYISTKDSYYEIWKKNTKTDETELLWGSKQEPSFINLSPDRVWLIYAEEAGCYLFNIASKEAQRFADMCGNVAWDEKDKKFAYNQGESLFLMDFNVKQELSQPKEIYKGYVANLAFVNYKTLVFEAKDQQAQNSEKESEQDREEEVAETYDLYKMSLEDYSTSESTFLDFTSEQEANIEVSPDSTKLIYRRAESEDMASSAWLVNLSNTGTTKKVLEEIDEIVWGADSESLYYVKQGNIYYSTKDGLNKKDIVTDATQPIFFHNNKSQKL